MNELIGHRILGPTSDIVASDESTEDWKTWTRVGIINSCKTPKVMMTENTKIKAVRRSTAERVLRTGERPREAVEESTKALLGIGTVLLASGPAAQAQIDVAAEVKSMKSLMYEDAAVQLAATGPSAQVQTMRWTSFESSTRMPYILIAKADGHVKRLPLPDIATFGNAYWLEVSAYPDPPVTKAPEVVAFEEAKRTQYISDHTGEQNFGYGWKACEAYYKKVAGSVGDKGVAGQAQ